MKNLRKNLIALVFVLPLILNLIVFRTGEVVSSVTSIPVESIELSVSSISFDRIFDIGENVDEFGYVSQRIDAVVNPSSATNKKVVFSVSDESVAVVDNLGVVSPRSNGTTYVTATTEDGGHSATVSINVDAGYVERRSVVASKTTLTQGEMATITARVASTQALSSAVPVLEIRSATTQSSIEVDSMFALKEVSGNFNVFEAKVKGARLGEAKAAVVLVERATTIEIVELIDFSVVSSPNSPLSLEFDGMIFNESFDLVSADTVFPLSFNRDNVSARVMENALRAAPVATIINDELVFSGAGTVTLELNSGEEWTQVEITSTFKQIDVAHLEAQLEDLVDFELMYKNTKQIFFEILPFDYYKFFDIEWSTTSGLILTKLGNCNVTILANHISDQVATMTITNKSTGAKNIYNFNVSVINYGVSSLSLSLTQESFLKGLENRYVFGNQNLAGQDFEFSLKYDYVLSSGATLGLTWESDNEELIRVDNNGNLVFNSQYDFDTKESDFALVSVLSAYPSPITGQKVGAQLRFEVVEARNASTRHEFLSIINAKMPVVLHSSIVLNSTVVASNSIYGNGFRLDFYDFASRLTTIDDTFLTLSSSVVVAGVYTAQRFVEVRNLTVRGLEVTNLSAVANMGVAVDLFKDTALRYCVIEGAAVLVSITLEQSVDGKSETTSNATMEKCLLRNAGMTGVFMGDGKDTLGAQASDIFVGDIIFENCATAIFFNVGVASDTFMTVTFNENLFFYNFIEQSVLESLKTRIDMLEISFVDCGFESITSGGKTYRRAQIVVPSATLMGASNSSRHRFDTATQEIINRDYVLSTAPSHSVMGIATIWLHRYSTLDTAPNNVSIEEYLNPSIDRYDIITRSVID